MGDTDEPLDFSIKKNVNNNNGNNDSMMSRSAIRTSVIRCAPAAGTNRTPLDPVTEHFRRSLGRQYTDLMRSKSTPLPVSSSVTTASAIRSSVPSSSGYSSSTSSSSSSSSSTDSASINGKKMNHMNNNNNGKPVVTPVKVDVDDHFAKALGDQWTKLKSGSRNSAPASSSQHKDV